MVAPDGAPAENNDKNEKTETLPTKSGEAAGESKDAQGGTQSVETGGAKDDAAAATAENKAGKTDTFFKY